MNPCAKQGRLQRGSSLIEVLVTLVILMLGLLGLVGLMVQSQRAQLESYQRMQALLLLDDMVNRLNTNHQVAACYVVTTGTDGTPYLGTGSTLAPQCAAATASAEQRALALQDLAEWHQLLLGSAEQIGAGANKPAAGAMVGARGCIELTPDGQYQISVVWQGRGATLAPAGVNCANGLYDSGGGDAQRRAVSAHVRIISLS